MEFEQHMKHGQKFWFSGIYKITEYHDDHNAPYYQAFYIPEGWINWGNYIDRETQRGNQRLTFDQCVALCEKHAEEYEPTTAQLKQAKQAKQRWLA